MTGAEGSTPARSSLWARARQRPGNGGAYDRGSSPVARRVRGPGARRPARRRRASTLGAAGRGRRPLPRHRRSRAGVDVYVPEDQIGTTPVTCCWRRRGRRRRLTATPSAGERRRSRPRRSLAARVVASAGPSMILTALTFGAAVRACSVRPTPDRPGRVSSSPLMRRNARRPVRSRSSKRDLELSGGERPPSGRRATRGAERHRIGELEVLGHVGVRQPAGDRARPRRRARCSAARPSRCRRRGCGTAGRRRRSSPTSATRISTSIGFISWVKIWPRICAYSLARLRASTSSRLVLVALEVGGADAGDAQLVELVVLADAGERDAVVDLADLAQRVATGSRRRCTMPSA